MTRNQENDMNKEMQEAFEHWWHHEGSEKPTTSDMEEHCKTMCEIAWSYGAFIAEAKKPAVPDAFGTREGEHPQYVSGWNDCREEMLKARSKK